MRNLFVFTAVVFAWVLSGCSPQEVVYPENLAQLHQNVMADILGNRSGADLRRVSGDAPPGESSGELLESLGENGSWPDIDYSNMERGGWLPADHLSRLLTVAKAYRNKGSGIYHKKSASEKVHKALDFWLENDLQCPNWWYPEIGVPRLLAPVMLLMEAELTPQQMEKGLFILDRAKIGKTGQNKVWLSGNVLLRALLMRDTETIGKAAAAIQSELVVGKGEGVQPDWSYHQHGPMLQFGNYGLAYIGDMIKWVSILRNTPFAFDENRVAILRNYLLEGQQWVTWKNFYDISSCGRQLFKNATAQKAQTLARYLDQMHLVDPTYSETYQKAAQWETLNGNRFFRRSDYMVHRTPEYFFSVKMASDRVIGAETVNTENIQGYHMGDGATFLYQTTKEYENIFPFWDWKKIPGTTAHQGNDTLPYLNSRNNRINSSFVGGVSDGENGIAVISYNRDGLKANKSWFMFNDMIVCLGSGIRSETSIPVATSVNQSFLNGPVLAKTVSGELNITGKVDMDNPKWLLHSNTGYFFPNGGKLKLEAQPGEGSWKRVVLRYPDEKLKADIFSLWFDHGVKPAGNVYAYVLVPNAEKSDMEAMEKGFPFTISNMDGKQEVAATDGSMAGIVFYGPGKSTLFGGIEVDKPCVVMIKKQSGGVYLSLAEPTQKLTTITLKLAGYHPSSRRIDLPQGDEAGSSVKLFLE